MASDLDKAVGTENEDVVKKFQKGVAKDPVDSASADELFPEKAMPLKQTPVPYKITGGGNGG